MNFFKNIYHYCLAWLGSIVYSHPSRQLTVIGITGTKGKTTSAELLHAALEGAGIKTAMLSSAHIKFGSEAMKNPRSNTMPGRFFIQRFLRTAVTKGCTHAVFEVTSQGVVQHRHRFIDFDAAAMTNLHPEHIESHGSFEKYRAAKVSFFRYVRHCSKKAKKLFFVNAASKDKQYFTSVIPEYSSAVQLISYSKEQFVREVLAGDTEKVSEWLRNDFNLENAALVHAIAIALGAESKKVLEIFKTFAGVAGRLEFVKGNGKTAVIDYALTPDSLRAVYTHLRSVIASTRSNPAGRLIAVFGSAGGGRDTWKRPELGKIASELCDKVYLTTDDSYDEDPEKIIADIAAGVPDKGKIVTVLDRATAIREALVEAEEHDIVVITGMGSQSSTYGPGGKKIPWSDRKTVEEILSSL